MRVIGIDPGLGGAIALYDTDTGALEIIDMPVVEVKVNRSTRREVSEAALLEWFRMAYYTGIRGVFQEDVGGRKGQSASAAFSFGWVACATYTAALAAGLRPRLVVPTLWKRALKVRGKTEGTEGIEDKVNEVFGAAYSHLWRGPKGGIKHDRAEAALISKYGAQVLVSEEGQ